MKYILALLLFVSTIGASGQTFLDTTTVLEKAKLLTTSRFGLFNITESNISDVLAQKAVLVGPKLKEFLIIEVKFGQTFKKGYGKTAQFGKCNYLIAFNVKNYTFYRLGGFDVSDSDAFLDVLSIEDYTTLSNNTSIIGNESPIELWCYLANEGKKMKRREECHCKCSEEIRTTLVFR